MHHLMRFSFKNTESWISKEMVQYLCIVSLEVRNGYLKQGRTRVWHIELMACTLNVVIYLSFPVFSM